MSDGKNPAGSGNIFSLSNLNTKIKVMMVAAIPLILTLGIGLVASLNLDRMSETSRWVNHTQAVLEEANTIVAAAVDMETGMRGYLLAGKETFLDPYQNSVTAVYSNFARLRETVSDNPAQVARLTEAEHVLTQWQTEVAERQIELRRAIGDAATMNDMAREVRKGEGKFYFDNFRVHIGTFIRTEEALLEQRTEEFSQLISLGTAAAEIVENTVQLVDHTHRVIEKAKDILASAIDMETGMRGFLLSGDPAFLEPYETGQEAFQSLVSELSRTVKDNPAQVERLSEISKLNTEWRTTVIEPILEMRRAIGNAETMDDMADLIGQARGKMLFDQFREIMAAFISEEEGLMALRTAENERTAQTAKTTILGAVSATILIGSGIAWLTGSRIGDAIRTVTTSMKRLADGDSALPIRGQSRRDEVGAMARTLGVFRESIIREKALETEVRERVEQMAALLDALPDNYFRLDMQGTILDYRIRPGLGISADPVAHFGHTVFETLPSGPSALLKENMRKLKATQEILTWKYSLEIEDKRRDRDARLCPISGSDEMVLVVRDISDRSQAERERALVETRLEQIITSLPGAVISRRITKSEGEAIIYVSSQSADIWGYTPEEIYATKGVLETTVDPIHLQEIRQAWVEAVETLEPYSRRYPITNRSGEPKWLETNTNVYAQEDGSILTVGFILDVTAEVGAQQQLEAQKAIADRAQKLESIGQLTGGVAHDFNNLLAAIMGSLELLRDGETETEQLSLIDAALSATRRGAELTRNMLAFARRATLEPSVIELNTLVNETCNWAGRTLPSKIEVETSLLARLWSIKADVSSTESALLNLILNARDAMPEGGKLTIETANVRIDEDYLDARQEKIEPGRYVMLAVSDTGHGMPDEILKHIFEPFFSTKAPGAGTGLGLSMILGFMRQSGGTVQVYSEPDAGTTFKLYFKALIDEIKTVAIESSQTENSRGTGQQILVAEDEKSVRTLLVTTLEKAGYRVTAAGTGDEALALFEANPTYDLLLTDIVMPGSLLGPALSRAIHQKAPDLPVVFMSGYASEATVHGNGLQSGDIRLTKPVMRADLLAAIKNSLGS